MTKTTEAFLEIVSFIKKDCGKFKPGQCWTCEFLDRNYKRCMMASIFHEPNSYTEEEIRQAIKENEIKIIKQN